MTVIRCMVGVNALAQAKYAKGAVENRPSEGSDASRSLQRHGKDTYSALEGLPSTSGHYKEETAVLMHL